MGTIPNTMAFEAIEAKMAGIVSETIPGKLAYIQDSSSKLFTYGSLTEANDAFINPIKAMTAVTSAKETGMNEVVTAATVAARQELAELVETLLSLEVWLQLSIPTISDGNNFGVEIQEHICKFIAEKKTAAKALFDGLNKYNQERGDLWGKTIFPVVESKKASKGSNKATGGEKGDTAGTSESEDVSTAYNMVVSDAVVALAGHDTQHYFNLKMIFQEVWKIYATVLDQVTKNMEKLKNPRNDGGGGSGGNISMF